jgi:hypothetical protein
MTAHDGEKALDAATETPFDVIVPRPNPCRGTAMVEEPWVNTASKRA